ncbi:MAG TPA: hypothetical protein VF982_00320 [Anaerolineales bacterium]
MLFLKYLTPQQLDEGFVPAFPQGKEIFYRTPDYPRYKQFKGHVTGQITPAQVKRYDRHAAEIAKLLDGTERVLSLGGGTGALERRLKLAHPGCTFTVSDIYEREPVDGVDFSILDMSDAKSVQEAMADHDTVLICNALSPMKIHEAINIFHAVRSANIQKVIVYSAEDMRPIGAVVTILKRIFKPHRTLWCGYYYNSRFIKAEAHSSAGLKYHHTWKPQERGWLTPLWGSTYLSLFTKAETPRPDVDAQNLLM